MDTDYIWTPPQYDVSQPPFEEQKSLLLPSDRVSGSAELEDFARTIKW